MNICQKIKKIGSIELPRWTAIATYILLIAAVIFAFLEIFFPELVEEVLIWYAIKNMEIPY
jgi:predicted PurR-regulated permease PerM